MSEKLRVFTGYEDLGFCELAAADKGPQVEVDGLQEDVGGESLHQVLAGAAGEQEQAEALPEAVAGKQKQIVGEGQQLDGAAGNQQLEEAAGGEDHQVQDETVG